MGWCAKKSASIPQSIFSCSKTQGRRSEAVSEVVVGLREISDFGIIVIVIIAIGRLLERWENEKPWEGTNLLFISFYSITFVQRIAFLSRRVQNRNLIEFACKTDFRSIELEKMFRFSWLICSFILVFFVFFSFSFFLPGHWWKKASKGFRSPTGKWWRRKSFVFVVPYPFLLCWPEIRCILKKVWFFVCYIVPIPIN